MANANLKEIVEVDRSIERAAYHEAGHVWAYIKSGVEVAEVRICSGTGCYGQVRTEPPYVVDITDRMSVTDTTLILFAGCVAEEIYHGDLIDDIEGDLIAARELIYSATLSELFLPQGASRKERRAKMSNLSSLPNKCDRYLVGSEDMVRDVFYTDWDYIDAIAVSLLEKGRLTGEEIAELVQEVPE